MKFTDGYWNIRPGVNAHYPVQVHGTKVEEEALTVFGPTRRINHRGDTLNCPVITARFSSPMENVIRVELVHHKGSRPRTPQFELKPQPVPQVQINDDDQAASLTSGSLTVRVEKAGDWKFDFLDGSRLVTSSAWHGVGFMETPEGQFIHDQLSLGVGECVYGSGRTIYRIRQKRAGNRPLE